MPSWETREVPLSSRVRMMKSRKEALMELPTPGRTQEHARRNSNKFVRGSGKAKRGGGGKVTILPIRNAGKKKTLEKGAELQSLQRKREFIKALWGHQERDDVESLYSECSEEVLHVRQLPTYLFEEPALERSASEFGKSGMQRRDVRNKDIFANKSEQIESLLNLKQLSDNLPKLLSRENGVGWTELDEIEKGISTKELELAERSKQLLAEMSTLQNVRQSIAFGKDLNRSTSPGLSKKEKHRTRGRSHPPLRKYMEMLQTHDIQYLPSDYRNAAATTVQSFWKMVLAKQYAQILRKSKGFPPKSSHHVHRCWAKSVKFEKLPELGGIISSLESFDFTLKSPPRNAPLSPTQRQLKAQFDKELQQRLEEKRAATNVQKAFRAHHARGIYKNKKDYKREWEAFWSGDEAEDEDEAFSPSSPSTLRWDEKEQKYVQDSPAENKNEQIQGQVQGTVGVQATQIGHNNIEALSGFFPDELLEEQHGDEGFAFGSTSEAKSLSFEYENIYGGDKLVPESREDEDEFNYDELFEPQTQMQAAVVDNYGTEAFPQNEQQHEDEENDYLQLAIQHQEQHYREQVLQMQPQDQDQRVYSEVGQEQPEQGEYPDGSEEAYVGEEAQFQQQPEYEAYEEGLEFQQQAVEYGTREEDRDLSVPQETGEGEGEGHLQFTGEDEYGDQIDYHHDKEEGHFEEQKSWGQVAFGEAQSDAQAASRPEALLYVQEGMLGNDYVQSPSSPKSPKAVQEIAEATETLQSVGYQCIADVNDYTSYIGQTVKMVRSDGSMDDVILLDVLQKKNKVRCRCEDGKVVLKKLKYIYCVPPELLQIAQRDDNSPSMGDAQSSPEEIVANVKRQIGDWEICFNENGREFFYNVVTQTSVWKCPDEIREYL